MVPEIEDQLAAGELARLIPTVADSKKEERATSTLLSTFMVVPMYAREVLGEVGAPIGKRSSIKCYTEVAFKTPGREKKPRPDGLVKVTTGKKSWTALVEAKIGNSELSKEQIETYIDLAKQYGVSIDNFFEKSNIEKSMKVLDILISKAAKHLDDALAYTLHIPRRDVRIRLFCLWPLFFAIKTLSVAKGNKNLVQGNTPVKISRNDVYKIMFLTTSMACNNHMLTSSYNSLRKTV